MKYKIKHFSRVIAISLIIIMLPTVYTMIDHEVLITGDDFAPKDASSPMILEDPSLFNRHQLQPILSDGAFVPEDEKVDQAHEEKLGEPNVLVDDELVENLEKMRALEELTLRSQRRENMMEERRRLEEASRRAEEEKRVAEAKAKKAADDKKKREQQTLANTNPSAQSNSSGLVGATPSSNPQFLLQISNPDPNYRGSVVTVEDRANLEGLVMAEYGTDYIGAVLVAQAIRDSMIKDNNFNTLHIKKKWGYTPAIRKTVNQKTKDAVAYVFDQGGSGVQHPIYYFYASNIVRSKWHETQKFIVQRQHVRFFAPWK